MMNHQRNLGVVLLAVFGVILFWLMRAKGQNFLSETVSTTLLTPDPATGAPQYDSNNADTQPNAIPIRPIDFGGSVGQTCPDGYELWHDIATQAYACFPAGSKAGQ